MKKWVMIIALIEKSHVFAVDLAFRGHCLAAIHPGVRSREMAFLCE